MNAIEKFEYITQWFVNNKGVEVSPLQEQTNSQYLIDIKETLGPTIPDDINTLFSRYDGEQKAQYGAFLGHTLLGLEEILKELQFSKSLEKPQNPNIANPEQSNQIIDEIHAIFLTVVPEKDNTWQKLTYNGSANSRGGPYFYRDEESSVEWLELSEQQAEQIQLLFTKLHQLEKETYNWDEISCELYSDGTYKFERKFFNFNRYLTSFPTGCIKPIYYNVGWLPLIKDHGGNFIGIDLDPDEKGTAGQVIVYGRDDTDMFVVANSWTEFLDFNIKLIKTKSNELLDDGHLHDLYREMIVPSN